MPSSDRWRRSDPQRSALEVQIQYLHLPSCPPPWLTDWLTTWLTDRGGILQAFNNLATAAQPAGVQPLGQLLSLQHAQLWCSLSLWRWDLLQMLLIFISGSCGLSGLYYWLLWPTIYLFSRLCYTIITLHTSLQGFFGHNGVNAFSWDLSSQNFFAFFLSGINACTIPGTERCC